VDSVRQRVSVEDLTIAYGDHTAVSHASLAVATGKVTILAGPNGCGKSTLLRSIRRIHAAESGRVLLDGTDIARLKERDLTRAIGLLAQTPSAPEDMTVEELVRLGRYPHQTMLQPWSRADADAVAEAMFGTGVGQLAGRRLGTLSGGQLQRVWIAIVLAQESEVICLDEPVNHLDMAHQIECLDLVSRLNVERSRTVIVVLHDLNLAARYADRLVFMKDGEIVAEGPPDVLMTEALIGDVFGIRCQIINDPVHDRPLCIPIRNSSPRFSSGQ
jgi:iron complex transport system ATP-binding protein